MAKRSGEGRRRPNWGKWLEWRPALFRLLASLIDWVNRHGTR
jgi:hypothetical protein